MRVWSLNQGDEKISISALDACAANLVERAFNDLNFSASSQPSSIDLRVNSLTEGAWELYDQSEDFTRKLNMDGDLVYHLSDRVIFHIADKTQQQHCLHAAAVDLGGAVCVIPAQSGAGKSSLTAWLVANECAYLTDELILINSSYEIEGVARPIQIKASGISVIEPLLAAPGQVISGGFANAITPEMLGGKASSQANQKVGVFLFPQYQAGAEYELTRLSSAKAGLKLMSNHVNARNLKDHGFRAMMHLIRTTPCFTLNYGGFEQLPPDFVAILKQQAA